MSAAHSQRRESLADLLVTTWAQQGRDGFLLTDPEHARIEECRVLDPSCGITFRFRWMPHREIRGDVAELERRGILNPHRNAEKLFKDPRDPHGRHCFLCGDNIVECHPKEVLVPITLDGRDYFAGANFAWIERDHFTVMSAEHRDQAYCRHVLEAMVELHERTGGRFRVLFNGTGAGATVPWHLHFQITTEAMPIETITPGQEDRYPTGVRFFSLRGDGIEDTHGAVEQWLSKDRQNRSVNLLVATIGREPYAVFFPRDQRYVSAAGKGLIGGFEVAGDFVLSAPHEAETFRGASAEVARDILGAVRPPGWSASAAA